MNLGVHKSLHGIAFWTQTGKVLYLERNAQGTGPDPGADRTDGRTLLDDFAKYYRTVLSDGKSRILQILNDEPAAQVRADPAATAEAPVSDPRTARQVDTACDRAGKDKGRHANSEAAARSAGLGSSLLTTSCVDRIHPAGAHLPDG